jgi:hypothetical protein
MISFYVVVDVPGNENADDSAASSFNFPVCGGETLFSNIGFNPAWFRGGLNSYSLPSSSPVPSEMFGFASVGVNTYFARRYASDFFGAMLL